MIRRSRVQFLPRGESMLAETGWIHPWGPDPGAGVPAYDLATDPLLQCPDRLQAPERLRRLLRRHAERMHVRVDQSRHHSASSSVDHAGHAADGAARILVRTDRDEPPTTHSERRGFPKIVVDRQDPGVDQDQVGWSDGALCRQNKRRGRYEN